jgi:hypothetical protein
MSHSASILRTPRHYDRPASTTRERLVPTPSGNHYTNVYILPGSPSSRTFQAGPALASSHLHSQALSGQLPARSHSPTFSSGSEPDFEPSYKPIDGLTASLLADELLDDEDEFDPDSGARTESEDSEAGAHISAGDVSPVISLRDPLNVALTPHRLLVLFKTKCQGLLASERANARYRSVSRNTATRPRIVTRGAEL